MRRQALLIIIFIISFVFLLLSYTPNLYEASVVELMPNDRVMLWGEHIYTYDYNVYLSKIRQGAEGRWSVVDKYDNNPNQKGVFLQMLYLLSGKIGGFLRLTPPLTFHLLRTILSFLWILTIIYLNIFFLKTPKRYTIGILLSLLAASFPVFYRYQNEWWVGYHMSWWTELDVLKRISYIPHYTLNYIIIAILSILLYKSQIPISKNQKNPNTQNPKNKKQNGLNLKIWYLEFIWNLVIGHWDFILICLILFLSFFIHPAAGILFLFSWLIYHFIKIFWFHSFQWDQIKKIIIYSLFIIIFSAIPLLYFRFVTSDYPWKSLTDFDKYNRYPIDVKEYILALGPVFFTGVLGAFIALVKKEQKFLSLVSWILGAFVAIFVFKKFPYQSELRFVQTANHIPLAILTVYFLNQLLKVTNNFFMAGGGSGRVPTSAQDSNNRDHRGNYEEYYSKIDYIRSKDKSEHLWEGNFRRNLTKLNKWIGFLIIFLIAGPVIALGLVQSYFSLRSQTDFIHQRAVAVQPLVPYPPQVMYPLKDFWQALMWLEKNTARTDVVLSQVTAGNYIPSYSGNFVYLGHNPETPHYDERVTRVNQFFSGTMSEKDALNFLKEENISYVFYGPQEKEKSVEDIKKYSFLKSVFLLPYVAVYRIEKIK